MSESGGGPDILSDKYEYALDLILDAGSKTEDEVTTFDDDWSDDEESDVNNTDDNNDPIQSGMILAETFENTRKDIEKGISIMYGLAKIDPFNRRNYMYYVLIGLYRLSEHEKFTKLMAQQNYRGDNARLNRLAVMEKEAYLKDIIRRRDQGHRYPLNMNNTQKILVPISCAMVAMSVLILIRA